MKNWIPDAELEVLKCLWQESPLTARQLARAIYDEPTTSNIGTVQKLLQRLEEKECVVRDRSESVHTFTPAKSEEEVAAGQLDLLAQKISGGSFGPFLTHLIKGKRLSRKERAELKRLLGGDK